MGLQKVKPQGKKNYYYHSLIYIYVAKESKMINTSTTNYSLEISVLIS